MRIAIIGGGPGGYEAALVGAQLGAQVTLIDRDGVGGACVLWDCVPSKTLIAMSEPAKGGAQPVAPLTAKPELRELNGRVKALATAQSQDIAVQLAQEKVTVLAGTARFLDPRRLAVTGRDGKQTEVTADAILIATGARPRVLAGSEPDGERILSWRQLYDLPTLPERLIVVGSGVTGVEFANVYQALGSSVTLVSSRDRVLPSEDPDAATLLEEVFRRRGMTVVNRARAAGVVRTPKGVKVTLTDGREIEGTHCLLAVGSVANVEELGLDAIGVRLTAGGQIQVDRVSRTNVNGVYAAGDCTGVLMLASVAAMQGRIAMWHALGEAVTPLRLSTVAANVFTDPEIATVGVSQRDVDASRDPLHAVMLPLSKNARAKMQGVSDGFVKLFSRPGTGAVVGGVVVAPRASELIFSLSMAVRLGLTVDQLANSFTIYPSVTGSLAEAARRAMKQSPH
jgi:pyruvate/2-oxoglutarate dehydrogenase complex dihydrolipoamide dehydrogenase (E3) component